MRVGPTDGGGDVDMGPVITREHLDSRGRLSRHRPGRRGRDRRRRPRPPTGDGFLIGPSVLDRVEPGMRVAREEIFGPVLSVVRAGDLDEALAVGRDCPYGNGASIFTRSGWAARQFKHHFNAGMIGINVGVPAPMAWFPFTGWNQSFFGDLHIQGTEGDPVLHAAEDDHDPLVRDRDGLAPRPDLEVRSRRRVKLLSELDPSPPWHPCRAPAWSNRHARWPLDRTSRDGERVDPRSSHRDHPTHGPCPRAQCDRPVPALPE